MVTRNGKPVAILLSIKDEEEMERLLLAYSPRFQRILEEAKRQIREGEGVPHEEFWREVEAENW